MSLEWLNKLEQQKHTETPKVDSIPLHILNEDNILHFFKQKTRTKLYELKIRFYNNSLHEIQTLLDKLFQEKYIKKDKNGWISLKGAIKENEVPI